jgi:hypothetical protein
MDRMTGHIHLLANRTPDSARGFEACASKSKKPLLI